MKVSFLVPVYNEERTLEEVVRRVESLPLDKQIVVVDDGSTDDTPAILERLDEELDNLVAVTQPNRGKGAAVRRALAEADGDVVVIQDADMEYDPAEVPALIAPIEQGARGRGLRIRVSPAAGRSARTSSGTWSETAS